MIRIEQKKIHNKPFYYLTEQINLGKKFKKIQVFIGKNIPTDTKIYYVALKNKEKLLLLKQIENGQFHSKYLDTRMVRTILLSRIDWKYAVAQKSESQYERSVRDFAIRFIFESNAIEGSRLSQSEVSKIVRKQYIKKSTPKREIQEVLNAIEAFEYIRSGTFVLNQKSIKQLHSIVTKELDVPQGFKKEEIIVNNKKTVDPQRVRSELTRLVAWYNKTKRVEHSFARAIIFHNRFEHIHPFTDGNGRTGRLILNWMLMRDGYGFILFKNRNKRAYMHGLDKGDEGRYQNIFKLSINSYVRTINELIRGNT